MLSASIIMPRRDLQGLHLLLEKLPCPVLWLTDCAKPGISKGTQPSPPKWPIFSSVLSLHYVTLKPNAAHLWSFEISFFPFEDLLPALFHWCFFSYGCLVFVIHLFLCTSIYQHHRILESKEYKHLDKLFSSKIKTTFTFHLLPIKNHSC